ncbi:MAG: hypothetical protein IKL21_00725 [Clostridia bacterium]|nr:hypothetical protein [Clostridia bacterium]
MTKSTTRVGEANCLAGEWRTPLAVYEVFNIIGENGLEAGDQSSSLYSELHAPTNIMNDGSAYALSNPVGKDIY